MDKVKRGEKDKKLVFTVVDLVKWSVFSSEVLVTVCRGFSTRRLIFFFFFFFLAKGPLRNRRGIKSRSV